MPVVKLKLYKLGIVPRRLLLLDSDLVFETGGHIPERAVISADDAQRKSAGFIAAAKVHDCVAREIRLARLCEYTFKCDWLCVRVGSRLFGVTREVAKRLALGGKLLDLLLFLGN